MGDTSFPQSRLDLSLLRRETEQRRRLLVLPGAQTPHLAVAHEAQAGSQVQGSKGAQVPLHFMGYKPNCSIRLRQLFKQRLPVYNR